MQRTLQSGSRGTAAFCHRTPGKLCFAAPQFTTRDERLEQYENYSFILLYISLVRPASIMILLGSQCTKIHSPHLEPHRSPHFSHLPVFAPSGPSAWSTFPSFSTCRNPTPPVSGEGRNLEITLPYLDTAIDNLQRVFLSPSLQFLCAPEGLGPTGVHGPQQTVESLSILGWF